MIESTLDCSRLPDEIDDIFVCTEYGNIDGATGTLGFAGPQRAKKVNGKWIPYIGRMRIDSSDASRLLKSGSLDELVIHELAHVVSKACRCCMSCCFLSKKIRSHTITSIFVVLQFGIGVMWKMNNILSGSCEYRSDMKASLEYQRLSGCKSSIPLGSGAVGDSCGHWSESCLTNEILTGGLDNGSLPISRMTVATLDDLGYKVNYDAADTFQSNNFADSCECRASKRRRLSRRGQKKAEAFGKAELKRIRKEHRLQLRKNIFSSTSRENADDMFIGDKMIVVYYQEGNEVYDVLVTDDF